MSDEASYVNWKGDPVFSLSTYQLAWGGLFDSRSHDGLVHLGDPARVGYLLCGHHLMAKDGPGFSRGGGVSGQGIEQHPCRGCADSARERYPSVPIAGMLAASAPMANDLGVECFDHECSVPAYRDAEKARRSEREAAAGGVR